MRTLLLSATTLTSVSASMPYAFVHADQLDIVKNNANQVDMQVQRAALRFLQDDGPCDPDQDTQLRVMQSGDCKALQEAAQSMQTSSGSSEPSTDDIFNMINTICAPSIQKCLGTMMEEMTKAEQSAACQATQTPLLDEFAACKAESSPFCSVVSSTCVSQDGQCADTRQVGSGPDQFDSFELICARKDAETTCFEAVFRPIFEAMESAQGSGAIALDDSCGTLAADADEATSNLYGCCVLEGYGCCLKTIETMYASQIDTGEKADYVTQCPALANVKPCPNPFKDTTYLKFDLEVACLNSTSTGEDLVLLKEGLTDAWELDSGSIELTKGDTSKVSVVVTVPEDLSAGNLTTKIQNANVSTTALAAHKAAACDVADTAALQVTQNVVQASSAALAAIWGPLAILALF